MPEYFEALEGTGIENGQMKVVSIGEQEEYSEFDGCSEHGRWHPIRRTAMRKHVW